MQSKFDADKNKTAASLAVSADASAHKFDASKGSGKFDTEK